MNYFSVIMDGIEIFNPEYKEMSLDGAVCTSGVGEAGNMDFTFPTDHVFEKSLVPYGSTIEVFEDGVSVFYGRPLPPTIDILGRKKIHCEGALAFLGDVVCPPGVMGLSLEMDDGQYYAFLITYYNSNQNRSDRRLVMGAAPSGGVSRKREWTFRSCLDELRNNILPYVGGFVYTRREGNLTYLEWTTDFTQTATQPVALGLNLVDITRAGRQFYTAAIAKGAGDVYMTEPVELGAAILQKYGFICASLDYPSVGTVEALQAKCVSFLSEQQFNGMDFTIDALDLHIFGKHAMLKVGQIVTVRFSELEDPVNIPIRSIQTNLNTGIKKITVAFPADVELRSYTKANTISGLSADGFVVQDINSQNIDWINSQIPDWADVINPTGQYHYFIDEFGNTIAEHLEIVEVIDPETGETVEKYEPVFEKIPDSIEIIPNPDNPPPDVYLPGDQFDPSQYQVEMHYGDGTIEVTDVDPNGFNIPDGYEFQGDGLDPSSLDYTSPMGGVPLSASTGLNVQNTLPESIEIITPPTKTVYQDGETIDLTGIVVVARNARGDIWTSEQYPDGIIPIEELTCVPSVVNADTYYMGDILWVDPKDIHLRQREIRDYYTAPLSEDTFLTRTADFNLTISFKNVKCVALIYDQDQNETITWMKDLAYRIIIMAIVDTPRHYSEEEDGITVSGTYSVSYENVPPNIERTPVSGSTSDCIISHIRVTEDGNTCVCFIQNLYPEKWGSNEFGTAVSPVLDPPDSFWLKDVWDRSFKYILTCDAPLNVTEKSDFAILRDFLNSEKTHDPVISWNRPQDNNTLSTSLDITLSET